MSTETAALVKRIRALMAMANDKGVSEAEAASFAAKVQELLTKHGLSIHDVREVNEDSVGTQDFEQRWKSPARKKLLRAVCAYYMCEALGPADKHDTWTIIGRPHNVTVAVEMTDYLIKTVIRMSNEHGKKYGRPDKGVIDFRRGAMLRLAIRLTQMRAEVMSKKAVWNGNNPGNLPALFSSELALIKEQQANYKVHQGKARGLKLGSDAAYGMQAADTIGLHEQVEGAKPSGRLAIGKD